MAVQVRGATEADLEAIGEIYNHYVVSSYATFDEVPRPSEEWRHWWATYRDSGPYRVGVAVDDGGTVLWYACSSPYRAHPSFAETVELSVYISPGHQGEGTGSALYQWLFGELAAENLHRVVAGIALPNDASIALHRRFGFTEIGVFDEYARVWDRYVSSVWMQRALAP